MSRAHPAVELARALIQQPSVTPDDAGCQEILGTRLAAAGFKLETLTFGEVTNLYATRGTQGPDLCFAGHTDVVPTGPVDAWRHAPFAATIDGDYLHGRGSADMKGALAAMVTAIEAFVAATPQHAGRLSLLITSDEEGPSIDGTRRVVETLAARGIAPNYCVIGEPSSDTAIGDRVRHGRRGSLNARLAVKGIQGHVAYPTLARNPIHDAAPFLAALASEVWDEGTTDFPPTTLQISNVAAGTGANNVIPGELVADFNLRFSTALTAEVIQARVATLASEHDVDASIDWRLSGQPFLSADGALREATLGAIKAVTGRNAECSTSGGTSDGRFICGWCPEVIELGLVGRTIHQIDEHVAVADLGTLSDIYGALIRRLLS
ncbi:MAG: succinyl-diaminopimelate desuccinylase [Gammaproteobacteria bacterium]